MCVKWVSMGAHYIINQSLEILIFLSDIIITISRLRLLRKGTICLDF